MRPQVNVQIVVGPDATYNVEMLRSYVTSLLLPLLDTCDINTEAVVKTPTRTESDEPPTLGEEDPATGIPPALLADGGAHRSPPCTTPSALRPIRTRLSGWNPP